jgi:hypothetical protein
VGWCSLLGDTNRQQSGGVVQFTGGYKYKAGKSVVYKIFILSSLEDKAYFLA